MKVEEVVTLNILYDMYENMLTSRQQEVFGYYYHEDLSHQEIADILDISRSGVYDILKRTRNSLHELEDKLQFVLKYNKLIDDLKALEDPNVNKIIAKNFRGGNYE